MRLELFASIVNASAPNPLIANASVIAISPKFKLILLPSKLRSNTIRSAPAELLAADTASRKDSPVPLLTPSFSSLAVVTTKVLI